MPKTLEEIEKILLDWIMLGENPVYSLHQISDVIAKCRNEVTPQARSAAELGLGPV